MPTTTDTEDTLLEPSILVEGDALAATEQSLSCATSESALVAGRIEARSVGTAKVVIQAVDVVNDSVSFEVREATSLSIKGPEAVTSGEEIYLAADLRDADDRPLYASSSVVWTVLEGDVSLPEADARGELRGAFALVAIENAGHIVVRADAIGFSATIEIEAAPTE